MTQTIASPLSARLRAATQPTHEKLDHSVMAAASFATIAGYGRFVGIQWAFHRDIEALYLNTRLNDLLPELSARRRLPLITQDLADLGLAKPDDVGVPRFALERTVDIAEALGWLYVAEGSNLGAALLRKEAAKLGLSDDHGARHLAPAPEGPAEHWRTFTAALNAAPLTADGERRAVAGAEAAFARVQALVDAAAG